MNLLRNLQSAGISWALCPSSKKMSPSSKRESPTLKLEVAGEGRTLERHFHVETPLKTEQMLAVLLKEEWPDLPALREWLDSKGNVPVELEPSAMESIAECMHTALRKLADSKQSVITWNALHQMHYADRVAMWDALRKYLNEQFAGGSSPTRRKLAQGLKEVVISSLDEQLYVDPCNERGRTEKREPHERFALLAMSAACELTDIEEWMWGWLGYVVKDKEEVTAA